MSIKPLVLGVLAASMVSSIANAVISRNGRDVTGQVAAYDLRINANAALINIPGAEATGVTPGHYDSGPVTNLYTQNVGTTGDYLVQLSTDRGTMGETINVNDPAFPNNSTQAGLGLFADGSTTDIGGVLVSMELLQADGTTPLGISIPDQNPGGCTVSNNVLSFSGGNTGDNSCTIQVSAADLDQIDVASGGTAGTVQYVMAADTAASAGHTYQNDLNYTIRPVTAS